MKLYIDGIGSTAGGSYLVGAKPLYASGDIWYVDSMHGDDSWAGTPERPVKTLAYALTLGANGDTFVLLPSYAETITSTVNFLGYQNITIVGCGVTKPTMRLGGVAGQLVMGGTMNVSVINVAFMPDTSSASGGCRIVPGTNTSFRDCTFTSGVRDTGYINLDTAISLFRLESCAFYATSTFASCSYTPAVSPIWWTTGAGLVVEMRDVTFDGGTTGWTGYAFDGTANSSNIVIGENVSLLRGSDIGLYWSTVGRIDLGTCTGGGKVVW